MKFIAVILGILSCSLLATCVSERDFAMTEAERRAIATAESYVADRFPYFEKRNKVVVIKVIGFEWEITYRLPVDMIGGAPVVIVDMWTSQVSGAFLTQ
jgi:hypothetical protein